ncbi:MAG TPA: pyridoxal-phosphate dependent enzyme, partial [Armatimonadota bacterium]|nr:pyridoxal-phosphate dependent enzyme [Armatimonadota bacterium]
NKARQLEWTLGEALSQGADCLVQGGGAQSNHCRQTAAAAAKLGLECHLVLHGAAPASEAAPVRGNLLLDRLLGARIHWTAAALGPELEAEKEVLAARLRADGRRPYVIGGARGMLLGAAAYAFQTCELAEQCAAAGLEPDALYVCSAGATHAGLLLGARALDLPFPVQAIAPIVWDYDVPAVIAGAANELARELGLDVTINRDDLRHSEEYVGPGYGVLTREARVAIELVARTEGILLDPSYTGKAMAGLIDHIRRGSIRPGSRVVFVHTGGTPALFAYSEELMGA